MEIIRLRGCVVRVFDQVPYLETILPDGTKVAAAPQATEAYRETADRLGYGPDTWGMCREHELAHTQLLQALGLAYSPTLWAVAHGEVGAITGSPGEMQAEEDMVLAYQRWQNVRRARQVSAT